MTHKDIFSYNIDLETIMREAKRNVEGRKK